MQDFQLAVLAASSAYALFYRRRKRYAQALRISQRQSGISRKTPVTTPTLERIETLQDDQRRLSLGLCCGEVVGFSMILRVGELEALKWRGAALLNAQDGDAALRIESPRSKTDQYDEGHVGALEVTNRRMCAVWDFPRWVALRPSNQQAEDHARDRIYRKKLDAALKMADAYHNIDNAKLGAQSLRDGGSPSCSLCGLSWK